MIDRATISRIIDATNIVDVVSDFVTLRKAGTNYKGLCPFHDEKTPSFVVSPSKGFCKCFSCGKGGNAIHFIMEHEQLTYPDALRWLAKKYNIEIQERELTDEEKQAQSERDSMFVLNEWARDYFQRTMFDHPDGQAIGLAYFRSRGFRDDIIKKFQLGFCLPQKDTMTREALHQKFRPEYLEKTGLCYKRESGELKDRYSGRVIFPIHTLSGKVIAFGGRILQTNSKTAKYVNSPESTIYHKSNELYGLYFAKQAIVKQNCCFLVEGYTDVISMHQSGIENVVASSGTALTPGQIRLIHRFTENVTVLYDGDLAGIKASLRGIDMLLEEGLNVKVLLLPDGDDPDSFARKHNAEEYIAFINQHQVDFIRFKTNLLLKDCDNDPIKKAGLITNIVKSISVIPDAIIRSVYIKECSQLMEVEESILSEEVVRLKKKEKEEKNKEATRKNYNQKNEEQEKKSENIEVEKNLSSDIKEENTALLPEINKIVPTEKRQEEQTRLTEEHILIKAIVRYGEKPIATIEDEDGNERIISVIEYIAADLEVDGISFEYPIYQKIYQEAKANIHEPRFTAANFFLYHPDEQISILASQLISDRYQLSRYHSKGQKILSDEERLTELIPHLLIEFKLSIVKRRQREILLALKQPEIMNDEKRCMELMKQTKEMKEIERQLLSQLSERVITF